MPVKRARLRNLEREPVINERDREVLGHHPLMAIHRANSFTGASNICSATKKQSKASHLSGGSE